jgi:hypothetical protein
MRGNYTRKRREEDREEEEEEGREGRIEGWKGVAVEEKRGLKEERREGKQLPNVFRKK